MPNEYPNASLFEKKKDIDPFENVDLDEISKNRCKYITPMGGRCIINNCIKHKPCLTCGELTYSAYQHCKKHSGSIRTQRYQKSTA
jgi:hypothetical protein